MFDRIRIRSGHFILIVAILTYLSTFIAAFQVTLLDTTKTDSLEWVTHSIGNNNGRIGWREASFTYKQGDVVRVYTVCNVAATGVANWLRTPYIPTGNSNRIYIDIQFSMRKCTKYPEPGRLQQCKEAFKLLYHESDYDSATSTTPAWNEESYHHIDVVAADRVFTSLNQASINSETRSIPVTRNGIYFVFYDQGACTTLISVRIYYIVCPSVTLNFANFANTTTGLELTSVVQSEGTCVGHAVVEQPPSYLCKGDGNWYFLTGGCHCMPGYEPRDNNTQCVACPPQFYKWQTGNGRCIPCPVNSQASNDGSPECSCKENYYRGSNEDSTLPCTRPPSNVQNLTVTYRDQGTITLQWHQPVDLGGRTDVLYQVECYGCDDSVEYRPHQSHFNSTMVTLSGLNPGTTYTVVIYSLNGVSDTSGLRRMSDITVSTEAAVPPKVKNIRITSVGTDHISIAWSAHRQKMLVEVYEVRFWKDDSVDDSVSNFTSWNNITLQNMLQKTKYSIKVRGRTNKGWGEFSETIHGTTGHIFHYPAENPFGIVVGFAIAVIVCIIFVIILIAIFFKRNNSFCHKKHSSDCEMLNGNRPYPIGVDGTLVTDSRSTIPLFTPPGTLLTYVDPHTYEDPSLAVQEFTKEIDPACIIIESVIGGGEFGDVCKGRLKISGNGELIAAIKTLKSGASDKNRLDFLTEASIMGQFDNPNVIYLEGIVTKSHPIMIVTEYMENGSLDTFLRKNDGKFTSIQLVGMIRGIASGMGYLSEMGYIHRDLAARNILVNENLVCKVSDFGLSREMENDSSGGAYTTKGGKIPIRWTAPEAIAYRKFTTASDVWSYGIVMWEVMSYGERPYWNWTNQDVIKAIDEGYRLTPPMDCPFHIYKLMLNCWQKDRSDRPKFATIVETIDRLIRTPDLLQKLATNKLSKSRSGNQDDSSQSLNTASQTLGSVADWLTGIKMDRYIETFLNSGYTEMDQVAQITHKDLASLGVSLVGHQKKILNSVQTLKSGIDSRDTSDATLLP